MAVVAVGVAQDGELVGGELVRRGGQRIDPLADLRTGGLRVMQLGHEGGLLAAQPDAGGRQVDLFIPTQQAVDGGKGVETFEGAD